MARATVVLALIFAIAVVNARLMNERYTVPEKFVKLSRANPTQSHTFSLALVQKNLDVLEVSIRRLLSTKLCTEK
jgi:hypothetical protein